MSASASVALMSAMTPATAAVVFSDSVTSACASATGASLTLTGVMITSEVTVPPLPSSAVSVTVTAPASTSPWVGVPVSTPSAKVSHPGSPEAVTVSWSPSASANRPAGTVNTKASSSVAETDVDATDAVGA